MEAETLQIQVDRTTDTVTVVATGEVDLRTCGELEAGLDDALATGAGPVVLDLSGITFIDSTGLRVLIVAHQQGIDRARPVVMWRPAPNVSRLFAVTGLKDMFNIEP